jgi:lysozyme
MSIFASLDTFIKQTTTNLNPVQKTGPKGLQLIEYFEGLRLTAYQDTRGIWTQGYGHTLGVKEGDHITFDEEVAFLAEDLLIAETTILKHVAARLPQNQFDALVSFVYNVGSGNFLHSSVYADLQRFNFGNIPYDLSLWNKSNGIISVGLVTRRHAEGMLFSSGLLDLAPIAVPDKDQA